MGEFFSEGIGSALRSLGMVADDAVMAGIRYHNRQEQPQQLPPHPSGITPYPMGSHAIGAERFARSLQNMNDDDERPGYRSPDNTNYSGHNSLDRLTSWGSSMNLDENRGNAGFMSPSNPRG